MLAYKNQFSESKNNNGGRPNGGPPSPTPSQEISGNAPLSTRFFTVTSPPQDMLCYHPPSAAPPSSTAPPQTATFSQNSILPPPGRYTNQLTSPQRSKYFPRATEFFFSVPSPLFQGGIVITFSTQSPARSGRLTFLLTATTASD